MAKRKSKKPQEDAAILLEPSVSQSKRRINSHTSSALLFIIIFTVGVSIMGWFCVQQQYSLDQLSESFITMQKRITNLQQVMELTGGQTDVGLGVEERIFALEEAQKQAQETAEFALATSEKLKNVDHHSQLWALQAEMDARLTETKQVALSITNLQAMFKNQSEEFEAVKESVVAGLSSSSVLADQVAGLTNAVASTCARVYEQVASVAALNAQLQGQASDVNELKESVHFHDAALHTNNQEMTAIKALIKTKQAMHAQVLEEMLRSVQMTLDEQFFTSQTLRSSVMAQLQTLHTQLANTPSMEPKSNEEDPTIEDFTSSTAQNATKLQEEREDAEENDEQQEEEAIQGDQPLEQEVEGGVVENQGEEQITDEAEEQENKESIEQGEEQEVAGEAAGEEVREEEAAAEEEEEVATEKEEAAAEEEEAEAEEEEAAAEEEEEEEAAAEEEEAAAEEEEAAAEEEEAAAEEEEAVAEEEEAAAEEEEAAAEEEEAVAEEEEAAAEEEEAAAEEEEEAVDAGNIVDESSEEEVSEEVVESWESTEEESAELNSDIFMDENEEDG